MTLAFRTDEHMFDVIEDEGRIVGSRVKIEDEGPIDLGTTRGGCCSHRLIPIQPTVEDEGMIS